MRNIEYIDQKIYCDNDIFTINFGSASPSGMCFGETLDPIHSHDK